VAALLAASTGAAGQTSVDVEAARAAYGQLNFEGVIRISKTALRNANSRKDQADLYELLALSYGALDSTAQAIDAFRDLILVDPDREPDPARVSPRITALYAQAMGRVLVVRHVTFDSTSFVAGRGWMSVDFEVPRLARVLVDVVGPDFESRIDSVTVAGNGRVNWNAMTPAGDPVPAGRYQIFFDAAAGPDRYETRIVAEVLHAPVDTLPHVTSIPGREEQNEWFQPGRNWKPLGVATLYTAVAAGASLALENTDLANPPRKEIGAVSFAALVTGLVMSLKKPDPVPVQSAILYNQILREEIARRNADIAAQNVERRRQTLITVIPAREDQP
jgi:hypothetical protein